jgi:hypothetical protein
MKMNSIQEKLRDAKTQVQALESLGFPDAWAQALADKVAEPMARLIQTMQTPQELPLAWAGALELPMAARASKGFENAMEPLAAWIDQARAAGQALDVQSHACWQWGEVFWRHVEHAARQAVALGLGPRQAGALACEAFTQKAFEQLLPSKAQATTSVNPTRELMFRLSLLKKLLDAPHRGSREEPLPCVELAHELSFGAVGGWHFEKMLDTDCSDGGFKNGNRYYAPPLLKWCDATLLNAQQRWLLADHEAWDPRSLAPLEAVSALLEAVHRGTLAEKVLGVGMANLGWGDDGFESRSWREDTLELLSTNQAQTEQARALIERAALARHVGSSGAGESSEPSARAAAL